ncbi:hypothetical protein [Paenibacillus sp. PAMC21692]|uniref:hypothetical protein n=1 Tax=Paenibacillus sp. PAMC21692 TaxID=2762320 RepID=UPI00164D3BA0|nr:hypothetical protein [Paenibacillus sp. PAMC21692]QNK58012.1 hypothetical protein H7F31_03365 [Paenibacillus sp. PAMC21692]
MDNLDLSGLRQALRMVKDLSGRYGVDKAVTSLQKSIVSRLADGISANTAMPGPDIRL